MQFEKQICHTPIPLNFFLDTDLAIYMKKIITNYLLLIFICFAVFQCSENTQPQPSNSTNGSNFDSLTPFSLPGIYFPAYPVSEWNYIDNKGKEIKAYTDSIWKKEFLSTGWWNGTSWEIDTRDSTYSSFYYLPNSGSDIFLNKIYYPDFEGINILGYSYTYRETNCGIGGTQSVSFFCDSCEIDSAFDGYGYCPPYLRFKTIVKDTTMNIQGKSYDSIIIIQKEVREIIDLQNEIFQFNKIKRTYFGKNVGIVKESFYDKDSILVYDYELLNHKISWPND